MGKKQEQPPLPAAGVATPSVVTLRGRRRKSQSSGDTAAAELALLYGVSTKRLNERVKRNVDRFPEDFMFRLTRVETGALNRSQIATGRQKHHIGDTGTYIAR